MSDQQVYTMRIHYLNSTVQTFVFPQQGEASSVSQRIDTMRKREDLLLHMEDRLMLIPKQSILRIEITPCPPAWPSDALHGVRLIKETK
ncbi:MAG: hypothetical protein AMJ69_02755 [Gammaproteobacteria bacterium SG8_47]|nr:MAG: hypothetical protein AMJ69_02755 [Gammaproteobacteria bacterium SG8_47]